jgi:uncharacterized damage-inducible protein DinB
MTEVSDIFLQQSRNLLVRDYLPKLERCLDRLSDDEVWWRPNEPSNSVGNLLLHLCGNVTQWIVAGVGGRQFERRRQQEFDERGPIGRDELRGRIHRVVANADEVLGAVRPSDLVTRRSIQGYDVTVLEAVYHVVEHFSMHTGQVILITKMRTGEDLVLWRAP